MKPKAEALHEWAFWEHLSPVDRLDNTEGVPPYDVESVAEMILPRLLHIDMRDCPILDLGCGTGRLTSHLAAKLAWHEFWAMDISQRMLDLVPARENIRTYLCDGRTLHPAIVGGQHLAGAYSVTMFQHIPHEAKASYLAQVAALLQYGGRFVFTVAMGTEDTFLSHQVDDSSELQRWCDDAGLEILHIELQDPPNLDWTWVTTRTTVPL